MPFVEIEKEALAERILSVTVTDELNIKVETSNYMILLELEFWTDTEDADEEKIQHLKKRQATQVYRQICQDTSFPQKSFVTRSYFEQIPRVDEVKVVSKN